MIKSELEEIKTKVEGIIEKLHNDIINVDVNGAPKRIREGSLHYIREANMMMVKARELKFWLEEAILRIHN